MRLRTRPRLALPVLAAFLSLLPTAAPSAPTRTTIPAPHPLAVRLAASSEPLSLDDLVDAALAFSGVADADLPAYRRELLAAVAGFQRRAAATTDPAVLGPLALAYLHETLLDRYDVRQVRIDVLLDRGLFNCVSSSVLYLVLARSVGLTVGGVRTADHAFVTVNVGGATVDVETTNPYGYDPGSRTEFRDSFGRVTGFAYVPPSNHRGRTAIGERGLLALLLYDRVSFAIERGEHEAALEPAVTAWALAGDAFARSTLVTALSNCAVRLAQAERFDEAVDLIDQADRTFGADPDLAQRRREILHNQVVTLVEAGELDAAEALLASPLRAAAFDARDRRELAVWVVQVRADLSARTADYAGAAATIADGIALIGAEPRLMAAYEAYTHNAFARLFNSRRFEEAKALLESALSRHPDSRLIRQDLDATLKALQP